MHTISNLFKFNFLINQRPECCGDVVCLHAVREPKFACKCEEWENTLKENGYKKMKVFKTVALETDYKSLVSFISYLKNGKADINEFLDVVNSDR